MHVIYFGMCFGGIIFGSLFAAGCKNMNAAAEQHCWSWRTNCSTCYKATAANHWPCWPQSLSPSLHEMSGWIRRDNYRPNNSCHCFLRQPHNHQHHPVYLDLCPLGERRDPKHARVALYTHSLCVSFSPLPSLSTEQSVLTLRGKNSFRLASEDILGRWLSEIDGTLIPDKNNGSFLLFNLQSSLHGGGDSRECGF